MKRKQPAKIEMKNDGKDLERFRSILKTVVSVPKKEIQEREKAKLAIKAKKRLTK